MLEAYWKYGSSACALALSLNIAHEHTHACTRTQNNTHARARARTHPPTPPPPSTHTHTRGTTSKNSSHVIQLNLGLYFGHWCQALSLSLSLCLPHSLTPSLHAPLSLFLPLSLAFARARPCDGQSWNLQVGVQEAAEPRCENGGNRWPRP